MLNLVMAKTPRGFTSFLFFSLSLFFILLQEREEPPYFYSNHYITRYKKKFHTKQG